MRDDQDSWGDGPEGWDPSGSSAQRPPTQTKRRGGLIVLVSTGLAVVLAATLGIGAAAGWFGGSAPAPAAAPATTEPPPVDQGDEDQVTAPTTPLEVPTPTPGPLGDEAASEQAADTAIGAVVEAGTEIAQRADGDTVGLESIATGFVQGELQALALERSQLGFKQIGEAKVVSVTTRTVDLAASPPTVVLDVCIDASGIDVVDQNGVSQKDRMYTPGTPVLHTYGAQFIDGLWKIATHEIPDSAPCA